MLVTSVVQTEITTIVPYIQKSVPYQTNATQPNSGEILATGQSTKQPAGYTPQPRWLLDRIIDAQLHQYKQHD